MSPTRQDAVAESGQQIAQPRLEALLRTAVQDLPRARLLTRYTAVAVHPRPPTTRWSR
jgi:hypothetical protein